MKQLRLTRVSEHNQSTMGVLCIDNAPMFVTLEDAWRDNEKMVSCIPTGIYQVRLYKSPRFGTTYQVMNVEDRSHILFHAGNTHKDTHGCILLGMQFGRIRGESAILASRSAFLQFMDVMENTPEARLTIVDACGEGRLH